MLALVLCVASVPCALAGSVSFRWDYTASGASGFMVYCGASSRSYTTRIDAGNTDRYTVTGLPDGSTAYCAVTAYDAGRVESAYSNESRVVVPGSTTPPPPTASSYSIWPATAAPANAAAADSASVNLGVRFTASQSGHITGVRFYKSSANTGTHIGALWTAAGVKLAQATFSNETASGWQQVNFATPVAVSANTVYVASYLAPRGYYAGDGYYFSTTSVTNGPLRALQSSSTAPNGVYAYGTGLLFPRSGYRSTNYWVDVVFKPAP
jgi:hypothetical protein